eukprot:6207143-Pleurochrysis_carterae.AAC.2
MAIAARPVFCRLSRFVVFDAPNAGGAITERLSAARDALQGHTYAQVGGDSRTRAKDAHGARASWSPES